MPIRQRVLALDARINATDSPPPTQSKWIKRLGPLAPLAVLLAAAKTAFLLLFKLKFLLSFAAFFGVYLALYGLWFGAGFAISILIHELGHVVAVKRLGLKADLPVFLPGFGAYVRWQGFNISLPNRAGIALAGPLAGLLAAAVCMGIYVATQRPVFAALAHTGGWLNLLNLIPVWMLDGGQATHALSRLQRGLLLVTCIVFFFLTRQSVFLLVAAGMTYRLSPATPQPNPAPALRCSSLCCSLSWGLSRKSFPSSPSSANAGAPIIPGRVSWGESLTAASSAKEKTPAFSPFNIAMILNSFFTISLISFRLLFLYFLSRFLPRNRMSSPKTT